MNTAISAAEATITTCSIEVKALRIGPKQMTQAVFKQLHEKPLIDRESGLLAGMPWGLVNYHVDCGSNALDHVHAVWQEGSSLRRSTVFSDCADRMFHDGSAERVSAWGDWRDTLDSLLDDWLLLITLREQWRPGNLVGTTDRSTIPFALAGWTWRIHPSEHLIAEWKQSKWPPGYHEKLEQRAAVITRTLPEIQAEAQALASKLVRLHNNWKNSYAEIAKLDQLFIAV